MHTNGSDDAALNTTIALEITLAPSFGTHGMAQTSVFNLDSDLTSLGRCDLDRLEGEWLSSLPGHGCLAGDWLSGGC